MKKLTLASLSLIAIISTGCNRYYYKPNAVNAPMFTDGGQYRLGAGGSVGDGDGAGNTSFFDVQAAASPIKYLGIIGNYSTYRFRPDNPDTSLTSGNVNATAHLTELGVGGYYPLGGRKVKMVTDLYLGGGLGNIRSDVDMDVRKLFIQPGIGMASPWFDVGFSFRISNIKYDNFNSNGRSYGYLRDHQLIDNYGRRIQDGTYWFYEPTITLRAGYKFAKVQFQGAFAHEASYVPWLYNGARFTVGFYLSIEGLVEAARGDESHNNMK